LEHYTGNYNWQCHYIRGRCSCECPTKQHRKARALWGISS